MRVAMRRRLSRGAGDCQPAAAGDERHLHRADLPCRRVDSAYMPNRAAIIAISLVACVFGVLSIAGSHDHRGSYYAVNIVLSILASVLASLDLRRRGFEWGWAMMAAYLLPLIGTILYIVFSGQRGYSNRNTRNAATAG